MLDHRAARAAAMVLVLLALSACGHAPGTVDAASDESTGASVAPVEDEVAVGFDQWVTWDDGLRACVPEPEPYHPEQASGGIGSLGHGHELLTRVEFENEGETSVDFTDAFLLVRSDGSDGGLIFDRRYDSDLPDHRLQPGEEASTPMILDVEDPADVDLELYRSYDLDLPSALFSSDVG